MAIERVPDQIPVLRGDVLRPEWVQWLQKLVRAVNRVQEGTGSPEGVVTAPVGSVFLRSDGGASTTMYVKESGSGNTGWRAV